MRKQCWLMIVLLLAMGCTHTPKVEVPEEASIEEGINLARKYWRDGSYSLAKDKINKILASDPQNIEALIIMGVLHHEQGQLDEAIEWYQKTFEIDANSIPALHNVADAYREKREYNRALDYIEKAIEINPEPNVSQLGLAEIYESMGRYKEALDILYFVRKEIPSGYEEYVEELIGKIEQILSKEK